ncbi:peptidase M4 [Flexivirga endophytica]|uniref:Neutral metalloproteinase n=1 Tax=Flexivirga endophytica TaxID=1849103 RepID=A0A916WS37_9MICO|nr:M4 family metallopeptidase [Flexivirga endophytica]GGB24637.1 peptidase M4 [Flexivirga endophytica]GHB63345.1 peptidase M4 [Flexivirga endophytica]
MKKSVTSGALGAALVTAVCMSMPPALASNPSAIQHATTAKASINADHDALGLGSDEKLVLRNVVTDKNGSTHVHYERTYKGLQVVGGDLIVTKSKSGHVGKIRKNASGKVAVTSVTPTYSQTEAKATGRRHTDAVKTSKKDSTLVIFAGKGAPRLAYDVYVEGVRADKVPTRTHTYVDAHNGKVLAVDDEIETGTGRSIYVGDVTIGTKAHSGGGYEMTDAAGNYTTDVHNQGDPNTGTGPAGDLFLDSDDAWGNGSNSDRASAAVDAQYGAEKTFDYYKNVLGRNGIWNDGRGSRSRVHFADGMANAFWDGQQMSYGDGTNNAHPVLALDVAGHEMSHGVTENTAGLVYYGDAGGLNEANSDIFGTAVEWYANNTADTPDYLIGEKVDLFGNGAPLRYMDKPSKDGASKDCWSSTLGNLDPHYSSGPLNHWYYLASEGSGAKTINGVSYNSPTCNSSTVTGIGHDKAEKIWFRTLTTKLTSNSNYKAAREGAITSAIELYGASSAECKTVEASFNAIAVPAGSASCEGGSDPNPPTGDNLLKNPGFESGAVDWTGTAGPITNNSGRAAHTGSWKMWLGGNGQTASENESQTVSIPAGSSATLSYWVRIDSSESSRSYAYDKMQVQAVSGGTTTVLKSYSNVNADNTWHQVSVDLSAYAGKSVTLKFVMNEDSYLQTSFVVDDTSITAK